MKRTPIKRVREHLAYVETELLRHDLTAELRMRREYQRSVYLRELEGRCKLCGREIHADESLATGIGSTCRHKAAS